MNFNKFLWGSWWMGTILIVLSWIKIVPVSVGWVGFGMASLAILFSVLINKYWIPPKAITREDTQVKERRRQIVRFQESKLAHKYLDGLEGLEIGGSAHNPFGLRTKNMDCDGSSDTVFKQEEIKLCGEALPVDIVASGDDLPITDASYDFVVSSHVLEHFPDPIRALREWYRVIRKGGYIFMIIPHKERTFDRDRERTTLSELIERNKTGKADLPLSQHCSVWITEDIVELTTVRLKSKLYH
jgi:SAM-dependent methyltransferase